MRQVPPNEMRPPRMRPLASLPLFFDLTGKRVVVVGSSDAAAWKAELAAAAGAEVEVLAPRASEELRQLAQSPPAGRIMLIERAWREDDLIGASLAIGALESDEGARFAAAAHRQGVPVNIVDAPELSAFSFGTIVNRSPVVIGIGTSGAAPVLGQVIRSKIEALLHPALAAWAAAAQRFRAGIKQRLAMGPARRDVWRRFADRALAARTAPRDHDLADLIGVAPLRTGSVALVGAGPGDPELLTLKALRALQSADVILYDRLVSPEILELARREAKRMLVGKSPGGPACKQADINALMLRMAREGKRVVRLKGGDPMVFGRAAEEIGACRAAGIAIEVVPGITAAVGAAAELQVPLTDRRSTRRLQLVTGHSHLGEAPEHDWSSLADPRATTVFYMGGRTFATMLPKMLAVGLDPKTPALAVAAATTPRSVRIAAPVADLPQALSSLDAALPCLILIGRGLESAAPSASLIEDPPAADQARG